VRRRGGQRGRGGGRRVEQGQVERPRTDERGVSDEGRAQPALELDAPSVPAEVAEAPDTTTKKQMHDDPTKLEGSGDEGGERSRGEGSGSRASKKGRS
ncbi:MAG: hypothetical protein M3327_10035, partial [Actinomycetota bacterium]|nr:hypothetical protein [Actinomycetota bacterium]